MEFLRSYFSIRKSPELLDDRLNQKIENYKPGYPQFTALLSAYGPFFICRRFNRLRARLLLLKQDQLSILEQRLDDIDQNETSLLFLGKSRSDKNEDRMSILSQIESHLADYDKFCQSMHAMFSMDSAETRNVRSLQNWLNGTGCLAREEAEYLMHNRELVCLMPSGDSALSQFEVWVENQLMCFYRSFRKTRYHDISTDPNVYIYSGPLIKRIARVLLLSLITFLLLAPVVVCNAISSTSIRIFVIIVSTLIYLFILSGLTRSRTMELILAGATYATVLIVFVSGTHPLF